MLLNTGDFLDTRTWVAVNIVKSQMETVWQASGLNSERRGGLSLWC